MVSIWLEMERWFRIGFCQRQSDQTDRRVYPELPSEQCLIPLYDPVNCLRAGKLLKVQFNVVLKIPMVLRYIWHCAPTVYHQNYLFCLGYPMNGYAGSL